MPSLASCDQFLAAGSCETAIIVYDLALRVKHTLPGHEGGTNSLAFAKDSRLLSAGEDGHAIVWEYTSGKCIARLQCEVIM